MSVASHFTSEHAGALADLSRYGTAVTFTSTRTNYVHAPSDETSTPITDTVAGYAMRVRGNPATYKSLSLVEMESPTLLFAPLTIGQMPVLGSTVTFGGETYAVASVNPIAPDGVAIAARVVVSR